MSVVVVTGSAGLVGSEASRRFHSEGLDVVGIDNGMRSYFFGEEASTTTTRLKLEDELRNYRHEDLDIRNRTAIDEVFRRLGESVVAVIHAAAQPSHDWAARNPHVDFEINAMGTLNMLEAVRQYCPRAAFIFTSTNKVYGDAPNDLPLVEEGTRWEIEEGHRYEQGIDESMSIDQSKHSIFGASKLAADAMVQEYGRYFEMNTVCFRGGCLTGPAHAGTELHGFLSYLVKCAVEGTAYSVFGYKGKQVRDNIHSHDLVDAFWQFFKRPRPGEVYNIGGGRRSNCSILEAIALCQELTGRTLNYTYEVANRNGDHAWWVSDVRKFKGHYPQWDCHYDLPGILKEIHEAYAEPSLGISDRMYTGLG